MCITFIILVVKVAQNVVDAHAVLTHSAALGADDQAIFSWTTEQVGYARYGAVKKVPVQMVSGHVAGVRPRAFYAHPCLMISCRPICLPRIR